MLIVLVYIIPVGMILAITNQMIGLDVITELIVGYALPGRPIAMMMFKTWGSVTLSQALQFTSDFKLGHYMKIPLGRCSGRRFLLRSLQQPSSSVYSRGCLRISPTCAVQRRRTAVYVQIRRCSERHPSFGVLSALRDNSHLDSCITASCGSSLLEPCVRLLPGLCPSNGQTASFGLSSTCTLLNT